MANAEQGKWVERVLGLSVAGGGRPPARAAGRPAARTGADDARIKARDAWSVRRGAVVATLKQMEGAIRAMKDPQGDAAVILVRAIAANLTPEPWSPAAVAELRRYLETDSIIDDAERPNGFGIDVQIRKPLLPVLGALERAS